MSPIHFLPAIVCLAGALLYAFASSPKASRMGEILFFCGLLATLLLAPMWIGAPTVLVHPAR